ncbi:MAG TPA: ABC transporter permease [Pyrinomonadaceae bacterium]
MDTYLRDIRYSFRTLLKQPMFTTVIVLALALGIGANCAIFNVINTILLNPLPYPEADKLVLIWQTQPQGEKMPFAPADFLDFRAQNQVMDKVAAAMDWNANLTGTSEATRLQGFLVSPTLFPLLGVQAQIGRTFQPEEEQQGKHQVALLSDGLWQRMFNSDPNVLNRQLTLNGRSYTVVGVMPKGFQFPRRGDLWIPLAFDEEDKVERATRYVFMIGRIKSNVSQAQAQANMDAVARQLQQQYPQTNAGVGVALDPAQESLVGEVRPVLYLLLGVVGLVLLMACANVANLLLVRASARHKEVAIRMALGASRWRLVRQLLTESLVLALIGGGLGLLLSHWGSVFLISGIPDYITAGIPRAQDIGIDTSLILFTLAISVLTGVIFGLVPALRASKVDINSSLKLGGRSQAGGDKYGRMLSKLLVVAEVSMAMILLTSAGLMLKSFWQVLNVDPGFDARNVLTMDIALPQLKYGKPEQAAAFYQQGLARIAALPGVQAAGAVSTLPLRDGDSTGFAISGAPPAAGQSLMTNFRIATADYLTAMKIPLVKGRFFNAQDRDQSPRVVVINETMARRHFSDKDPLGQRLILDVTGEDKPSEIVGVIKDVKYAGLDAAVRPEVYLAHTQNPWGNMTLVTRTETPPATMTAAIRGALREVDKDQPISNVMTMQEQVSLSLATKRFVMTLLGAFALLALILAIVGLYGLISYSVAQRTHEIGVRMALGARPRDVTMMVVRQGMTLTLIGLAIGLVGSFIVTRLIESFLFGVSTIDPLTFTGVALVLIIVALLASVIPARRAARVSPIIALRAD